MKKSHRLSRRAFMQSSAAALGTLAAPAFIPATALGRDGAVPPSERIVMGCIGLGSQGSYDMQAFLYQSDVEVVAVCDVETESNLYYGGQVLGREPARRFVDSYYAQKYPDRTGAGCAAYRDFRDLLARSDIDAVTVVTPDHWHAVISIAAAEAGKDIYCEKPLANSIPEGRAVCNAIARTGRILQVGSHERSRDNARLACELVRNGRIGRLSTIRVNLPIDNPEQKPTPPQPEMPVPPGFDYDMWLGPAPYAPYTPLRCHFSFRYILAYSGGEITDRGAHIIDLAQLGHGTDHTGPVEITGSGWRPTDGLFDTFMGYDFECRYADGVRLIGQCGGVRGVRFEGDRGWIFIHIHGGNLEADPPSLLSERIGPGELSLGRSPWHQRDFLNCVRSRRQPMAPAEVGQRSVSICHLVNLCLLTGRPLRWDPEREAVLGDDEQARLLSRPLRAPWHV
ncbi:Gfo/Idh/MocA family oxidoreductase [bacterium]|nr:Gfo/Idh/MocA family oxidoreductase [bacterium]